MRSFQIEYLSFQTRARTQILYKLKYSFLSLCLSKKSGIYVRMKNLKSPKHVPTKYGG